MTDLNETPSAMWKRREPTLMLMPMDALWYDGFQCGQLNKTSIFRDDADGVPLDRDDRLAWLALHAGFVMGGLGRLLRADPVGVADILGQIAELLPETILAEELQRRLAVAVEQASAK